MIKSTRTATMQLDSHKVPYFCKLTLEIFPNNFIIKKTPTEEVLHKFVLTLPCLISYHWVDHNKEFFNILVAIKCLVNSDADDSSLK